MFSLEARPYTLCDRVSRRELLKVGGLGVTGLSLCTLLRAGAQAAPAGDPTFGRAKNVIYLWLQGGPPQHETFDPKPLAPVEIRGPFQPICTNVPGIQFCELLPRIAGHADKLAVVRSMATDDNNHDTSGYWVLTGQKYPGASAREIKPGDWPYFGSLVKMLKPSERLPALSSVWIPDIIRLNENVTPAGQTAGFLGAQWDPDRFIGDPADAHYRIEGLALQDEVTPLRLARRVTLFEQVGRHLDRLERSAAVRDFDSIRQAAFGLLTSGGARDAFRVRDEPERLRERYGKNRWGQCLILARRLIEAGVRLVHVGWPREAGDSAVTNPMWDTHAQNSDRLQDALCPMFDVGFSALLEDLDQRGLLDETLVVAVAEFGRTPKVNGHGGRDHWGHVFSFALAGAGISGGQVYGASDKTGGYPAADRVEPQELTATIFHLLGVRPDSTFPDRTGRPLPVTTGEPLWKLLGSKPATAARVEPGGDVTFVPPYDERMLLDEGFESGTPLLSHGTADRSKGWQASPIASTEGAPLGVVLARDAETSRTGACHAQLGLGLSTGAGGLVVPAGAVAQLSQQLRNPFAGRYTFSVYAAGGGDRAAFEELLVRHFVCRLAIFRFVDLQKDHRQRFEFASAELRPAWSQPDRPSYEPFEVSVTLRSQDDGAAETNLGVGVAVILERRTPGDLARPAGAAAAFIRIDDARLVFDPRPRDDRVTV